MSRVQVNNIGLEGLNPPEKTCEDPKCPWHGHVKVRGVVLTGVVSKRKAHGMVVVRHDYLHYVKKFMRYEKRKKHIHAHLPPCIEVREGDTVVIGETRPLSKTVSFVVLGVVKKAGGV
ncbi:30S ribosomal protein S17 [Thermosphaera sp.]|uniref:Small ribosomal subunit protein uS17 n=1 Tax=Thermosphaera aggregans TaxID=54254 RepID=A0A7C2BKU4_9CREN